mmetsp:Transcript_10730/g.20579  ORF Transcript_10730/g.20579 Transcript_10730/m.20579 type:complete len:228 (-) Transcript_10730:20-703(-)
MMESVSGLVGMLPDEVSQCEEFSVIFKGKKPFELDEGDTKKMLEPGGSFVVTDKTKWSPLDGTTFMVRSGPDYARKKTKKASKLAFYECVGVDTLGCPKKISNIGRFMNLRLAKDPTLFGVQDKKSAKRDNKTTNSAAKNKNKSKKSRQRKNKGKQKASSSDNKSSVSANNDNGPSMAAPKAPAEAKGGAEEEENVEGVVVPEHFIFQLQLPDYQPSMLSSQGDGEG